MESNNKKSFNVAEVVRRQGFCGDNVTAIKAAGVTEVTVNALGRIVVSWNGKLVMWDAPATPAGKLAAQRAILAAGLKLTGAGVLKEALPKQPAASPWLDPVKDEAAWEAARDAKAAEKTSELLDLLDQLAEEAKPAPKPAPKKEKKVKREPKPRTKKAE